MIINEKLILEDPKYHHRFTLYDPEAGIEFSDLLEINTLELMKLPKGADGTTLYDWASFIAAESEEELDMVAERNPEVKKAVVKLLELSADERARDLYERREKERRDVEAQKKWAAKQMQFDIAKNLLKKQMAFDEIADMTGLTREEVESLLGVS